ncbi:MAG: hypothetical protein IIY04_05050, partial [Oscillospiraceae bacterium]|nr:hypothetical protein [Oscillospiraceae bacterium]
QKECEALANAVALEELVHPETKTQAILKSEFIGSQNNADQTRVTAYSYDIEKHVEIVRMYGNDGHYHDVSVEWDEYLPLSNSRTLFVCEESQANGQNVLAARNNLCMYY